VIYQTQSAAAGTFLLQSSVSYTQGETGSYSGGSFAFATMTYRANVTRAASLADSSNYVATSSVTVSESDWQAHTGATPGTSYGSGSSDSFTRTDTVTNSASANSYDYSTYSLYQAGTFSGQTWNLSSFNLLMQENSGNSSYSSTTDQSLITGGYGANASWGGVTIYNIVGGAFTDSGSDTTVTQNGSQISYSLSEQGSFSNGSFGLSSFAFVYGQASQMSTDESGTDDEVFSATDDVGDDPTFSGTADETISAQDDSSSQSSLTEDGSYVGGTFILSDVEYSGSSSDTFSDSNSSTSDWSGGYAGTASDASAESGSTADTVSAAGSFAGGSWALSDYVLSGNAQVADSDSSSRQDGIESMGTITDGSSLTSSDSSIGSSSLYQSGTQAAGNYANSSYSYQDSSDATMSSGVDIPGMSAAQCWTEQQASTVVLGGTDQQSSAASYSYQAPDGTGTGSNAGSASAPQPEAEPVVQFMAPDSTAVAQTAPAQLVASPNGGGGAMMLGQPMLGQAGLGGMTPGSAAPVPVTVSLAMVANTGDWMNATMQSSQEVTAVPMTSRTLQGPLAAAGGAVEAAMDKVLQQAKTTSFGMQVWQSVLPALSLAGWVQGGSVVPSLVRVLTMDDAGGQLAQTVYRQPAFVANSSDPLVAWVDNALYNNGEPLTAGSAPLYGTYYDPRATGAVQVISGVIGVLNGPGLDIFVTWDSSGISFPNPWNWSSTIGEQIGSGLATLNGSSSMQAVSAQQALSISAPFIDLGINTVLMVAGAAMEGLQPLRAGIPGIGRPGTSLSVCRDAAGRALGQRPQDGCFSGRMLIDVLGGNKRADEIRERELVASRDEFDPNGPVEYKEVQEVFVHTAAIFNLHVSGEIIETTGKHPFYVVGQGWVEAAALRMGDLLLGRDGEFLLVQGVAPSGVVETLYNWRVQDYHTYFVGSAASGFTVWAHNACAISSGEPPALPRGEEGEPTRGTLSWKDPVTGESKWAELRSGPDNARTAGLGGAESLPGTTKSNWHHVEFQAIELMRQKGITDATLAHNWWKGPQTCNYCAPGGSPKLLQRALPNGSNLRLPDMTIHGRAVV
jgi:hypothetical protein